MSPDYISIRILPEAKQAIVGAALPRETISETIIRICRQHGESRHDTGSESTSDEWKQSIELQTRQISADLEQISADLEQIRKIVITDIAKPPHTPAEERELCIDNVDVAAQIDISSNSHRIIESRRDVSEREKELFASICKKGIEIEGLQRKFIDTVNVSNDSVVKSLVNEKARSKKRTMHPRDIERLIKYARIHCPEIVQEYEDIIQQYDVS